MHETTVAFRVNCFRKDLTHFKLMFHFYTHPKMSENLAKLSENYYFLPPDTHHLIRTRAYQGVRNNNFRTIMRSFLTFSGGIEMEHTHTHTHTHTRGECNHRQQ